MKRKPRNPKKQKLVNAKLLLFSLVSIGVLQAASGFTSYFMVMNSYGFPASELWDSARKYFQEGAPDLVIGDKVLVRFSKVLKITFFRMLMNN